MHALPAFPSMRSLKGQCWRQEPHQVSTFRAGPTARLLTGFDMRYKTPARSFTGFNATVGFSQRETQHLHGRDGLRPLPRLMGGAHWLPVVMGSCRGTQAAVGLLVAAFAGRVLNRLSGLLQSALQGCRRLRERKMRMHRKQRRAQAVNAGYERHASRPLVGHAYTAPAVAHGGRRASRARRSSWCRPC